MRKGKQHVLARTVIISTGAQAQWLDAEQEQAVKGSGVSTCATCDGAFYEGQEVIVVGGGDSAMEEALFLTRFASKVCIYICSVCSSSSRSSVKAAFALEQCWCSSTILAVVHVTRANQNRNIDSA
jgi:thioredoxin reductase